jgi:hypothetical protein
MKQVGDKYRIMQVGLTIFTEEERKEEAETEEKKDSDEGELSEEQIEEEAEEEEEVQNKDLSFAKEPVGRNAFYLAHPFNFYVFPEENYGCSNLIIMETSAIEFHIGMQMDFNKWIYQGNIHNSSNSNSTFATDLVFFHEIKSYSKYKSKEKFLVRKIFIFSWTFNF